MPAATRKTTRPGAAPASPGLVYKGRWKVLHPLTETDRSYLFLGSPLQGGGPVAIKVLKERRAKDTRFMKLHHADMQAAVALPRHPGLVPTFDAGWVNGRYVVVTEFAGGEPLTGRLAKVRPLPYPALLASARQIVALLAFAYDSGVRFRHIEPEHLIFDEENRSVRLLRFSIPRSARLGISPPKGVDTDIQVAGALLFRMLTGAAPAARGEGAAELLTDSIRERCAAAYPEVTPDEVHDLATVYLRTATRDQSRRYQTLDELDSDLAKLEREHGPLVEERRKADREARREALFATAYDTVLALRGEHDRKSRPDIPEDEDLRDLRVQRFLLAGTAFMFLALAISILF